MSGAGPEFDPARLDAYLKRSLAGTAGAMRLERIAGGQSNPTFFVTYDTRRLVLRKQPPGDLLPSAHAVDREFRVISALAPTGVPVPEPVLFCADREVVGTPFYLMERLKGRVFHDAALAGAAPEERRALYRALAESLAALHAVDPGRVGLADFGRPTDYFARQIARWGRQWDMSHAAPNPDIDRLRAWLAGHIPADERVAVAHGDYRMGNVMFHPQEPRVLAILDWELSTLGHPLLDLAHACIAWHSRPQDYGGLDGLDRPACGLPEQAEFEAAYYAAATHDARLDTFHMVLALFRFAVIFEGIAARGRAGNAASADAGGLAHLSGVFARRAADLLDAG
ncbi:phosphotransferase family protein [Aquabacter spiritensis]|uniref:Aminoglycoside phosphotransferase (APT) family kinase protein n=1 Tax=Aquabacter spiritensis TaxID=933073 RepID=A0A4R3M5R4_9HYPH|nr:phosphotransferase family protein [Aquabacter spiritensis]TCT06817.1 aminoglycoside phosphotransferase (APT) family kinase protein [Aquabacter spiritensis]